MKKKIAIILLFMILFLIGCDLVKACDSGYYEGVDGNCYSVDAIYNASYNQPSGVCNTGICGSTFPSGNYSFFNAHKPSIPIYGVRVTLVNGNGDTVYGHYKSSKKATPMYINFWATKKFRDVIETGMPNKGNYFSNITSLASSINVYASDLNFFNCDDTGSKKCDFDGEGIKYENIIDRMENYNVAKTIYDKYLNCNAPGFDNCVTDARRKLSDLSFEQIASGQYYYKVEPIFVYYASNSGSHRWYIGTAYEIGVAIKSDIKKGNLSSAYQGAINCGNDYNYGWGGDYYVFDNWLTSIYLDKNIAGYSKVSKSTACPNRFNNLINNSKVGWSKIIIDLSNIVPKKVTLRVYKRYGSVGSKNLSPYFWGVSLYKKNETTGNFNFAGYKLGWVNSSYVEFDNLTAGDYYIKESRIPTSVKKVHFRQRTANVGDYSIDIGSNITPDGEYAQSNVFHIEGTRKEGIIIYNDEGTSNNTHYLRVTKKKGTIGNFSSYGDKTTFVLYKKDPNGNINLQGNWYKRISTKEKGTSQEYINFENIDSGTYILAEEGWNSNTTAVTFLKRTDTIGDYSIDLGSSSTSNKSQVFSNSFTYDSSKNQYILVLNDVTDNSNCGCSCRLEKLKTEVCSNLSTGICYTNTEKTLNMLQELYDDYKGGDFNLLFNYTYDNSKTLDISKTACGHVDCTGTVSSDSSNSFSCTNGVLDYKSKDYNYRFTSDTDANLIDILKNSLKDKKVCYRTEKSNVIPYIYDDLDVKCGVSYEYNTDYFSNETVYSGSLLWRKLPSSDKTVGTLKINLSCSKSFVFDTNLGVSKDEYFNNLKIDSSIIIGEVVPSMSIKLNDSSKVKENFSIIPSHTYDYISPNSNSGCDNENNCYVSWDISYDMFINYSTDWYLFNGKFYKDLIDNVDYISAGSGLPISVTEKTSNNLNAVLSFTSSYTDNNKYSSDCLYNVKNDIIKDDCDSDNGDACKKMGYNFDFRIIDFNNPFPGKEGIKRNTGSNWCGGSNIGKIYNTTDDSGKRIYYMIGDTNNDLIVDNNDYISDVETFKSNVANDIDGDGEITFTTSDCNSSDRLITDNCILYRYVNDGGKACNGESDYNSIIKNYITDATNSYSTDLPMYSFTLTASDINKIRSYNSKHSYNDFNLKCDEDGNRCLSNFLTDWIKNHTINNQSVSYNLDGNSSSCYNDRYNEKWCSNN